VMLCSVLVGCQSFGATCCLPEDGNLLYNYMGSQNIKLQLERNNSLNIISETEEYTLSF